MVFMDSKHDLSCRLWNIPLRHTPFISPLHAGANDNFSSYLLHLYMLVKVSQNRVVNHNVSVCKYGVKVPNNTVHSVPRDA